MNVIIHRFFLAGDEFKTEIYLTPIWVGFLGVHFEVGEEGKLPPV